MKKIYYLKGLDCPNCAQKIEDNIKQFNEVQTVNVQFINKTLTIQFKDENAKEVISQIKKRIHELEPEVELIETIPEEDSHQAIIQFISSLIIYLLAIILQYATSLKDGYLPLLLLLVSYFIIARKIIKKAFQNLKQKEILDENFLMTIATIGAFFIGEYLEAVAVMLFYQLGEIFQHYAVNQSRKSIANLMSLQSDYANIEINGKIHKELPENVQLGDIVVVKAGERIPLDGEIIEGTSFLDTVALTGESIPRQVTIGDKILSGCLNQEGSLKIKVTSNYQDSTVNRILELVENVSNKKSTSEQFITKFAKYYTPTVVIFACLIAILPPLITKSPFSSWIYRALSFLVVSCPCALVISVPLSFFAGAGLAAKRGILIKGSNYLEALSQVDTVIFDKTGTLTKGVFEVQEINSIGITKEKLLELVAQVESYSNHPIALSIQRAYQKEVKTTNITQVKEIPGQGLEAQVDQQKIIIGNEKLMKKHHITIEKCQQIGTILYVAIAKKYCGYILISDQIKPNSPKAIQQLKKIGIKKIAMITGDKKEIGESVAQELELDTIYTELLPHEKVEILETILTTKSKTSKVVFVGDGINDAPVLAISDIGVSMGKLGSDAAIEASDIVLMTDDPLKLVEAIKISKKVIRVVKQNIVLAIAIKVLVLFLSALGLSTMWNAVFADVGVSILATLNALKLLIQKGEHQK